MQSVAQGHVLKALERHTDSSDSRTDDKETTFTVISRRDIFFSMDKPSRTGLIPCDKMKG